MPEFILDHGTREASATFKSLDLFTQGYIEAIFWLNANDADDECVGCTFDDMAPETLQLAKWDCKAFQVENEQALDIAYTIPQRAGLYDEHQAGVDFWLTRNGHGAGFWDRGLGEIGDKLTAASKTYSMLTVYLGDDEQVHFF